VEKDKRGGKDREKGRRVEIAEAGGNRKFICHSKVCGVGRGGGGLGGDG